MIQEHYWFQYTKAPSTTIWSDWTITDIDYSFSKKAPYIRMSPWDNWGEWNYFYNK
jgi:hypothetical protein